MPCMTPPTSAKTSVRLLAQALSEEQLLDLLMLAGWYHAISFTANGARVGLEDGAPRFTDVQSPSAG